MEQTEIKKEPINLSNTVNDAMPVAPSSKNCLNIVAAMQAMNLASCCGAQTGKNNSISHRIFKGTFYTLKEEWHARS